MPSDQVRSGNSCNPVEAMGLEPTNLLTASRDRYVHHRPCKSLTWEDVSSLVRQRPGLAHKVHPVVRHFVRQTESRRGLLGRWTGTS
jgi:hypothetical protein